MQGFTSPESGSGCVNPVCRTCRFPPRRPASPPTRSCAAARTVSPHPVSGQWKRAPGSKPIMMRGSCRPPPASRKPTDPTLQGSCNRSAAVNRREISMPPTYPRTPPRVTNHPPQTTKGPYAVHIVRSLRNLWNWNLRTRNSRNQSAVISSLESMSKSDMANERIAGSSYVFM